MSRKKVEGKEPGSVGAQGLEVGDLEEEENNIAQEDDDVAGKSVDDGFANKFER